MKYTRQLSILTLVLMLGIPAVAANPILDFVQEKTKWLFFDLGSTADDQVLVLRLLLFVVLFSLLYAVTSIGPMAHFPGNARTMLCIALGLITVVIIPVEVLLSISAAYGALFTLLMLGVPTVGVAYLVFTKLSEETTANYSLKAVICLTLWYVLNAYDATVAKSEELSAIAGTISDLISTLSLLFMVYGLYSVYAAISTHGKGKVASGWSLKNLFGFKAKAKFNVTEANTLMNKIEVFVSNNSPISLLGDLEKAKSELLTPLVALHSELASEVLELADSPKKTAANTHLAKMATKTSEAEAGIDDVLVKVEACISAHNAAVPPAVGMPKLSAADLTSVKKKFKDARVAINDAANAVSKVEQLIAQAQAAPPTP